MTSSVAGLRRSSKVLSNIKLATKKASCLVILLPVWPITAFRIPVKPLHLRSMLSKSMSCAANCSTRSWGWSIEKAQIFSMITPNRSSHNQGFKSWMNWATRCVSSAVFTWPLTNQLPLLQASLRLFAGKTLPQPAGCRKCFPRVPWILKYRFVFYRNIQTYFSLEKICWL